MAKPIDYMSIILTRNDATYYGGETVEGSLAIMIRKHIKTSGVNLYANGDGNVLISESSEKGAVNHYRNEKYFHFRFDLISMETKEFHLWPGFYSQQFSVHLPQNLPASFKCAEGSIAYNLTAVIEMPDESDKVVCQPLTVKRVVDLNLIKGLREPVDLCDNTLINKFCYKSGLVSVIFRLKKTGFVYGENLVAEVCIENRSPRDMLEPRLILCETVKLISSTKSKVAEREVISVGFKKKIPSGSSESFKHVGFMIPINCSTSPDSDQLIQVKYFLLLRVEARKASEKIEIVVPIIIGTVPLREEIIVRQNSVVQSKQQRPRVEFNTAIQNTTTFRC